MTGRKAKIKLELTEVTESGTMKMKKPLIFPRVGYCARGIIVNKLLDWLLDNNITFPGKLIMHGITYDIKRFGSEKKIEVINLGNEVYVNRKDYEEVKK